MLKKIEAQEIITTREAKAKYPTQYIYMLLTKTVDMSGQNDLGYVEYIADKKRNCFKSHGKITKEN